VHNDLKAGLKVLVVATYRVVGTISNDFFLVFGTWLALAVVTYAGDSQRRHKIVDVLPVMGRQHCR